ncbi:MAG: hypothetical protein P4L31_05270, partial [Candidatus Babeliales bacterium]|nr:hypothetical protein [Candidatus Babeliales bacterium]
MSNFGNSLAAIKKSYNQTRLFIKALGDPVILSGKEIKKRLGKGILIDPFNEAQVGPNSYNLRLHHDIVMYDVEELDMKKSHATKSLIIPEEGLLLQPGKLYLGRTIEYTETDGLVPMLEGRSSVGRLGLFIHITAGFGDVGFCG